MSFLCRVIKSPQDKQTLQEDLAKVSNWANAWLMKFNIKNVCIPSLFQIIFLTIA